MRYFGTDGIRMRADALLRARLPLYLGAALGKIGGKVLVARDVRVHSPLVERMLTAGLLSGDCLPIVAGILPTPALAYLAQREGARFAVMITASHNPPEFNGIKVFGKNGTKLSPREEEAIDGAVCALANGTGEEVEALKELAADEAHPPCGAHRVRALENAEEIYLDHVVNMFGRFDGTRAVLDVAHGCMAGIADKAFDRLGIETRVINGDRDGNKVNINCGSTHLEALLGEVKEGEIGFAFDGDGDRALAAFDGMPYDGDAILLALATLYRIKGKLRKKFVVGTQLSNSRLQRELAFQNTALMRTEVGDKHVLDALQKNDCLLGGEKSGHILMLDRASTGDGLITALSLLEVKKTIGSLPRFTPYPMREFNIPCDDPAGEVASPRFQKKLALAKKLYGASGRLIVRPSGTEPYIRVAYEMFSGDADLAAEELKKILE